MSSKIITTVIALAVVGPFAYFATDNAVTIKQNLNKQRVQIQELNTEYVKLGKEIDKTVEVKQVAEQEVQKIEQETESVLTERQKLEAELGAN